MHNQQNIVPAVTVEATDIIKITLPFIGITQFLNPLGDFPAQLLDTLFTLFLGAVLHDVPLN